MNADVTGSQSDHEQRVREAADGGWTYDGRAQPYVGDLRAVLRELDRLRAMEAAIREDCWGDRDPHGTFERYLNAKATS